MVYIKSYVVGKGLSLDSADDDRVNIRGIVDKVVLKTTDVELVFDPHLSQEVSLSFFGKNLTAINCGKENIDVIGDLIAFKVCKEGWCDEYKLTIGFYLSKFGHEGQENDTVTSDTLPYWYQYFL